jgi:hypothetical protein
VGQRPLRSGIFGIEVYQLSNFVYVFPPAACRRLQMRGHDDGRNMRQCRQRASSPAPRLEGCESRAT